MRAAQKLLGAPTIGGGVPWQGVVVEGVKGVKYAPKLPRMYENGKKRTVSRIYWLKNRQKRYTPETFLRNTFIWKKILIKEVLSYSWSKFWKSYMPPAAWIRVKAKAVEGPFKLNSAFLIKRTISSLDSFFIHFDYELKFTSFLKFETSSIYLVSMQNCFVFQGSARLGFVSSLL